MTQIDLIPGTTPAPGRRHPKTSIAAQFPSASGDHFDSVKAGRHLKQRIPFTLQAPEGLRQGEVTRGAWLTYLALRGTVDEDGVTTVGLVQLDAAVSRTTMQRRIRDLEQLGFIRFERAERHLKHLKRWRCLVVPQPSSGPNVLALRTAVFPPPRVDEPAAAHK